MKEKIKKPPGLREIFAWILFLVASFFAIGKKWNNVTLQEDKIRAEEKVKFYQEDAKHYHALSEEWKQKAKTDSAIIEYQKQNPKIIIEKYDKIRNGISMLNADSSIKYLSNRINNFE